MFHMIFCDDNGEFLAEIKRLTQKTCMTCIPKDEKYIIGKTFGDGLEVLKYKSIIKDIIKSKLIKELNIRTETIKLLELNCW